MWMPPQRSFHYGVTVILTPIYDQLRGERLNADIPPAWADPHQVPHSEQPDPGPVPAALFVRPPGPGADRATQIETVKTSSED